MCGSPIFELPGQVLELYEVVAPIDAALGPTVASGILAIASRRWVALRGERTVRRRRADRDPDRGQHGDERAGAESESRVGAVGKG